MLTKSKFDGYQIGPSVSNNNLKLKSISQENIFEEDDVERYDADTYRQKYGDRWKKFASSVRDVVQPDGTVIREYVIEDPTLLEQLSEEDENKTFKIEKGTFANDLLSNKMGQKSSADFFNEFKTNKSNLRNNLETKGHNQKNLLTSSSSSSSAPMSSSSSGTSLTNSKNINLFQPINNPIQNLKPQQHLPQQQNSNNHPKIYNSKFNDNSKLYNSRSNIEDVDKEVEIIHEQSKQLQKVEYRHIEQSQTIIEYEVLDEHGNQITINGAEHLKKLAACVNEIKQSDGSVVKEYILNDPKVIEQIRTQMKTNPPISQNNANKKCQNQPNIETFSPLPSMSSTAKLSTPYINQVKQQIQKFQQTTPPPPPPPPIPVVPKPVKNFEYKTKKGKVIRLTVNGEDITESDCEELRSVLTTKEPELVKSEIQKNLAFQPKHTQMIKSGSLDNILDSKPAVSRIIPTGQKSNLPVYLNYLNQTKSINKLDQKTTNLSTIKNELSSKSQENLNEDSYFKKVSINQTYTKSTRPNFKYPIIDDAKKVSNNLNSVKKLNKSMDDLDSLDSKEKAITPEMTEQLLLKLLLHQIALQKEEKEKKKADEDDDRTSLSNDTFSSSSSQSRSKSNNNQRMFVQGGQISVSRNINNGQNIGSDLTKSKKILGQKSMSNFNVREIHEDSDDDFESLIQNKNMNQFNAARNKLRQNFF